MYVDVYAKAMDLYHLCIYLRLWSQILVVGAATFAQRVPYQSGILTVRPQRVLGPFNKGPVPT